MDEINLAELRNKCLNSLYACTENISKYLNNDDDRTEAFNKLKSCVTKYCMMEQQEQAGKKAIQSFEEDSDVLEWDALRSQFENKLTQHSKQCSQFNKHPFMKELENHIKIAERSREGQNSQNLEQDLAITDTRDNYIDPISKRPISNPMRNKICKHVYDKETIDSIVKNKKNKGCPCMGCTNKQIMLPQHLEPDEELLLIIRRTQQTSGLSQEEL